MSTITSSPAQLPMDYYSVIKRPAFEGAIGALFAVAVISAVARFVVRVATRRPLYWDDLALAVGVCTLTAATGIVLKGDEKFFLNDALEQDQAAIFTQPPDTLLYLVTTSLYYVYSFLALAWTTIFAVKISFLIFFKQLIQRLGKINIYYWVVLTITIISWILLVSEPFMLCPYFGYQAISCDVPSQDNRTIGLTVMITALDIITDIMIASIPVLVLRKSQIPKKQKFILGCFLCLSLVMTIFAIVRVSKIRGAQNLDIIWELFWMYMEAVAAVIMASLTAFRTIFSSSQRDSEKQWSPSKTVLQRLRWKRSSEKSIDAAHSDLPSIPTATLTGMRTYIRRNNRSAGATTNLDTNLDSSEIRDTSSDEERGMQGGINVTKDYTVSSSKAYGELPAWPLPSSSHHVSYPENTVVSDGTTLASQNSGQYVEHSRPSNEDRSTRTGRSVTSFI